MINHAHYIHLYIINNVFNLKFIYLSFKSYYTYNYNKKLILDFFGHFLFNDKIDEYSGR